MIFKEIFNFKKKTTWKAGDGLDLGPYKFFTSSENQTKFINDFNFDSQSLIFPTGGKASVHFCGEKFSVSADCIVVQPVNQNQVYTKYYYYYFIKNIYILEKGFRGAGLKHISKVYIENLNVPLLTYSEQKQIAKTLDKVNDLRKKRIQSIQLLNEYIKSVFYDMFGNPVKNDKGWKKGNLKKICEIFSDGPFGSNLKTEHYKKEGIRVIRLNNIGSFDFIDDNKVYISEEHYNTLKKYTCSPGDIVIGTLGEPNLRACIIPKHIEVSINKADCIHCKPNKDILLPEYLCFFLNTNEFIQSVSTLVLGETRGRISMGRLSKVNIMVPEIKIQKLFATIFSNYLKTKSKMEESLKEIENLFNSLMQKYFINN